MVEYRELESEFNSARGATIRMPIPAFALKGPQCEASAYTEYEQLNNVARVRDEAGAITPIEFSEIWQSADSQDYIFYADYPIGDDVFLENVRVRNSACTCEGPTQ